MDNGIPGGTRLAPTPSGFLHPGNAFNFLLAERVARSNHIGLRLRIDDGDAPRVRPEYLEDIFESLHWLGIRPDAGPKDPADHLARYSQAQRRPLYDAWIDALARDGHLFACTCSRSDIAAASADGQYPGTCRDKGLPLNTPGAAIRLWTPASAKAEFQDSIAGRVVISVHDVMRHPVIRRKDGIPAYAISSLADDVLYGISTIVRGEDLLHATALQLYIASLLPEAAAFRDILFFHHPLLTDGAVKLSKSAGAGSLRAMRMAGMPATGIRDQFSAWMAGINSTPDL